MRLLKLDEESKVRLPSEWIEELGLGDIAQAERVAEGILITRYPAQTISWDEVFSVKLRVGEQVGESGPRAASQDDALF